MITQLLDINCIPVQIQMKATPAKLEYDNTFQPQMNVHTQQGSFTMKSRSPQLQIDTYEARKSLGIESSGDFSRDMAQKSVQAMQQNIVSTVQDGNQMAAIENGTTIADIVQQKMIEQPELVTVFLPQGGADISFQPGDFSMQYNPADVQINWGETGVKQHYVPGSIDVQILQRPTVEIDFIGDPQYVPPSANPNYTAPEQ